MAGSVASADETSGTPGPSVSAGTFASRVARSACRCTRAASCAAISHSRAVIGAIRSSARSITGARSRSMTSAAAVRAERRESPLFQMQEQAGRTDQRVLGHATVQW